MNEKEIIEEAYDIVESAYLSKCDVCWVECRKCDILERVMDRLYESLKEIE